MQQVVEISIYGLQSVDRSTVHIMHADAVNLIKADRDTKINRRRQVVNCH